MNSIWTSLILAGILIAFFTHSLDALNSSILTSAKDAVELLIGMTGILSIWNGLLQVAEDSGLTNKLSALLRPFIHFMFPSLPRNSIASKLISINFISNCLGLGWVSTPVGLQAMKELQQIKNTRGTPPDVASNEMCAFLLLNISSLQLVPMNMIAYRLQYGSHCPFAIVGPALLATSLNTLFALLLCKCFYS